MRILVSAGEASGDMYAAHLVERLRRCFGSVSFFGCTGPRLREAGAETVIDAHTLSVVGLAEVLAHLPRIYGQYRRLVDTVRREKPDAAILTDSPDFHLRLARHLRKLNIPVYYLVAPQVWAWRQGRVRQIRDRVRRLFCLFPFEEEWFRARGVDAHYIGHPLSTTVRPRWTRAEFQDRHGLAAERKTVALLPGSRAGEAQRHLPILLDAVDLLRRRFALNLVLATPHGFAERQVFATFRERLAAQSIKVIEDETWDVLAHADVALAASGTVTVEAAVLGAPTVTFYKVTELTWQAGRWLVRVPYFSMVNLVAGRQVIPELIQDNMTPPKLADAVARLLAEDGCAEQMRRELNGIRDLLTGSADPFDRAANLIAADFRAQAK